METTKRPQDRYNILICCCESSLFSGDIEQKQTIVQAFVLLSGNGVPSNNIGSTRRLHAHDRRKPMFQARPLTEKLASAMKDLKVSYAAQHSRLSTMAMALVVAVVCALVALMLTVRQMQGTKKVSMI